MHRVDPLFHGPETCAIGLTGSWAAAGAAIVCGSIGACPDWRARAIGGRADRHQIGRLGDSVSEPKSEVEAAVAAARLNAKYAPALNGATIGVRKTEVNGETIYALRVAGLSKADAIALCVRVKGRDCSIIK